MGVFGCLRFLIKWTIIIFIVVYLINTWLHSKKYLLSDKIVSNIAKKYHDSKQAKDGSQKYDVEKAYKLIHAELLKKYPGHILAEDDLQWILYNHGGWMGSVCVVHSSLTEYVIFIGAAVETSGHTGRMWGNFSDTVLTGEFTLAKEQQFSSQSYKSGETFAYYAFEGAAVNFKADTWLVEYGRGFIPFTMFPYLADTFFSTTDYLSLFYMLKASSKALLLEASYYVAHVNEIL